MITIMINNACMMVIYYKIIPSTGATLDSGATLDNFSNTFCIVSIQRISQIVLGNNVIKIGNLISQ